MSATLSPIEQATDTALCQLLRKAQRAGSTYQLVGLVRDLRGSATRAETRAAVDRLVKRGEAVCYSYEGMILVRWKGRP